MKNIFFKTLAILGFVALFLSCEEEIGSVGTDIVGEVNFATNLADTHGTTAYTMRYNNGVQTNGVPTGVIGFYDDPVYGTTAASFVSQVALSRNDPNFGEETKLDSVIFEIPYFSTIGVVDEENTNYELDSIFTNTSGGIKLSAYRSNFLLNSLDPNSNFEDAQVYYSNEVSEFPGIEGDLLFTYDNFIPSDSEIKLTEVERDENNDPVVPEQIVVSENLGPRFRIRLDEPAVGESVVPDQNLTRTDFDWNSIILDQEGQNVLLNVNTFNDYFRGIYLKAESMDGGGSTILFPLTEANVTIYYSFDSEALDNMEDSTVPGEDAIDGLGSISLNFSGVSAVDYDTSYTSETIGNPLFNTLQNKTEGEENLYLKGGDGSIVLIDLFGPNISEDINVQVDRLRSCENIIINEANLKFYVNQDILGEQGTGELEPERIYIYDFDNNRVLADFVTDQSTGDDGFVSSRTSHLGRLTRSTEGDLSSPGVSYRIRLTQHVNNIIKNDSTNVRLALAVSQNVSVVNTSLISAAQNGQSEKRVPVSSVIAPEGTVLHGNLSNVEGKVLKLEINYTIIEEIDPNSPCGIALGLN